MIPLGWLGRKTSTQTNKQTYVKCIRLCHVNRLDTFLTASRKHLLYNTDPLKPHFYIVKLGFTGVYIFFLFLLKNIDCGYSLEPPRRDGSNEYPQSMFWAEIWKMSEFFIWKFSLCFLISPWKHKLWLLTIYEIRNKKINIIRMSSYLKTMGYDLYALARGFNEAERIRSYPTDYVICRRIKCRICLTKRGKWVGYNRKVHWHRFIQCKTLCEITNNS